MHAGGLESTRLSSELRWRSCKTEDSLWKRIKSFSAHTKPEKFENTMFHVYVCVKLGYDYHNVVVLEKFRFQNDFHPL